MTAAPIADVHAHLKDLFDHGSLGTLTDAQLLERFLGESGEAAGAAFAALVRRHAAMVYRVCLDTLGHRQDAEDAAQAVFLILARRARSVRRSQSTASWLHGVARRTALRARRDAIRRAGHERRRAEMTANDPGTTEPLPNDTWDDLHLAIDRLPEAYRAAIVLRHLEGLSHDECAERLRCPLRTFQSRLLRARDRLRDQLTRRGISLAAILPEIPHPTGEVNVLHVTRVEATAQAARALAAGATAPGASPAARALAASIARPMMIVAPIAMIVAITAAVCVVAVASARTRGGRPAAVVQSAPRPQPPIPTRVGDGDGEAKRTLDLHIYDKVDGTPIEGAEVFLVVRAEGTGYLARAGKAAARQTTDAKGSCRIEVPAEARRGCSIDVWKAGYVEGQFLKLWYRDDILPLPSKDTIMLERGLSIGGIVTRSDGTPVAGAQAIINGERLGELPRSKGDSIQINEHARPIITDAQGRWRFDEIPSDWLSVSLQFAHPDFVPPELLPRAPAPSKVALKARRSWTILDEGIAVEGRVVDEDDRPVAGATVKMASEYEKWAMTHPSPTVTTNAEGRFRFAHVPAGPQSIRATAAGHSPALATGVRARPGMKPLEIRLGPGKTIAGRVVDPAGKPIEGVSVEAADARTDEPSISWAGKTDRDGRFAWDSATDEPFTLYFARDGYVEAIRRDFVAGLPESTLTMYRPLQIRGKVTDARTGRPIPRFRIIKGYHTANSRRLVDDLGGAAWERLSGFRSYSDGEYSIVCSRPAAVAVSLRIEADGHVAVTSRPIRLEVGEATFDATLEPASGTNPAR